MKIARLVSFVLAAAAMVLQAGAAQAAIKTQWIDYKQGNTPLSGYLVYDDAVQGRRPGVLMIHDRSGFSEGTLADARDDRQARLCGVRRGHFRQGHRAQDRSRDDGNDRDLRQRPSADACARLGRASMSSRRSRWSIRRSLPRSGYCFGGTTGIELIETGAPLLGFVSVHGAFQNFTPEARQEHQGSRPHPARRRRSGCADGPSSMR